MRKKSNAFYLRELIKGNDEANEWLDALETEIVDLKETISAQRRELIELEDQYAEDADTSLSYSIDVGIGTIEWQADNLQLQGLMQELGDKVKVHTPLKIMDILSTL